MISVNLTVEQLESIHSALFFVAQYHDESGYIDDDATAAEAADRVPEKFYLVDRSEMHCGGLERVLAGPFDTQEECRAERIGWHDGRHIVILFIPTNRLDA